MKYIGNGFHESKLYFLRFINFIVELNIHEVFKILTLKSNKYAEFTIPIFLIVIVFALYIILTIYSKKLFLYSFLFLIIFYAIIFKITNIIENGTLREFIISISSSAPIISMYTSMELSKKNNSKNKKQQNIYVEQNTNSMDSESMCKINIEDVKYLYKKISLEFFIGKLYSLDYYEKLNIDTPKINVNHLRLPNHIEKYSYYVGHNKISEYIRKEFNKLYIVIYLYNLLNKDKVLKIKNDIEVNLIPIMYIKDKKHTNNLKNFIERKLNEYDFKNEYISFLDKSVTKYDFYNEYFNYKEGYLILEEDWKEFKDTFNIDYLITITWKYIRTTNIPDVVEEYNSKKNIEYNISNKINRILIEDAENIYEKIENPKDYNKPNNYKKFIDDFINSNNIFNIEDIIVSLIISIINLMLKFN